MLGKITEFSVTRMNLKSVSFGDCSTRRHPKVIGNSLDIGFQWSKALGTTLGLLDAYLTMNSKEVWCWTL